MEITFTCPYCGEVTLTDERFVGQSGPCRRCDAMVTVPKATVYDSAPPLEIRAKSSRLILGLTWCNWLLVILSIAPILFVYCVSHNSNYDQTAQLQRQYPLKQITLALRAYERDNGHLPRAFYRDAQREIVLPWRVTLLPYVDEERLYAQYARNEPWNSPTNYQVTAAPVDAYRHPELSENRNSQTGFVAVTGPGSLFVEGQDKRLTDGKLPPNEMIVLVEVPESDIHWSEPVDVDLFVQFFRVRDDHPEERRFLWRDGAEVAFADGTIRHLSAAELEKKLQAMFKSARPEDVAARFAALED